MTRRYGGKEVYLLRLRNHFLFEWMNIADRGLLLRHAAWLPRHVFREWFEGKGFGLTKSLWRALHLTPAVLRARARRRRIARRLCEARLLADAQLLALGEGFTLSS
jgi:hypothetical protein